ncbi:MAG: hypothetical protein UT34_C0002G0204 [candidate division WS6 bacterium GW2011_GWF2_39_15]|uniref:Uncharacterized protein n=1 Tax=candidate division WS6 bacterium GW2011_GWF2_39_15 TaxID=1619100 RepID=A0A0G0QVQ8_9BACT|nr:MAG: hypothetical protein UT34_C0002G0204 [candidate division WS6 bacterium GW2011_GWF2_39_15]
MLTKKDIQILREVFFEPIDKQFQEIRDILRDHNQRIMSLQDTIVGIDQYLNGELKLLLRSIENNLNRHELMIQNHEKRLKAINA